MRQYRESLDIYDKFPQEMINYLRHNGWHFNKKACEWAVSQMRKKNISTSKLETIEPWTKDQVEDLLSKYNISLDYNIGYDATYVGNMTKADFFKSSITTEASVAQFIKDMVDDPDQADGFIFSRFYSDCVRKGLPIPWDEVL